ncbi:MAG: alpha/beta hydrolase, partial [Bacteroidota bacterium]
ILKQLLTKYHGDKTDDVFYAWADTWLSAGFRTWNIEHLLPQISCPCLIVQGEQDEYGTMWQLEGIANSISGAAKVEVIKGIGHAPHKEAGELTLALCTSFVETLNLTEGEY